MKLLIKTKDENYSYTNVEEFTLSESSNLPKTVYLHLYFYNSPPVIEQLKDIKAIEIEQ